MRLPICTLDSGRAPEREQNNFGVPLSIRDCNDQLEAVDVALEAAEGLPAEPKYRF